MAFKQQWKNETLHPGEDFPGDGCCYIEYPRYVSCDGKDPPPACDAPVTKLLVDCPSNRHAHTQPHRPHGRVVSRMCAKHMGRMGLYDGQEIVYARQTSGFDALCMFDHNLHDLALASSRCVQCAAPLPIDFYIGPHCRSCAAERRQAESMDALVSRLEKAVNGATAAQVAAAESAAKIAATQTAALEGSAEAARSLAKSMRGVKKLMRESAARHVPPGLAVGPEDLAADDSAAIEEIMQRLGCDAGVARRVLDAPLSDRALPDVGRTSVPMLPSPPDVLPLAPPSGVAQAMARTAMIDADLRATNGRMNVLRYATERALAPSAPDDGALIVDGAAGFCDPQIRAADEPNTAAEEPPMTASTLVETAKTDATDAAWRMAGSQFTKLAKEPLVALLSRHISPDDESLRGRVAAFLETELGAAILSGVLSAGLSAIPAVGPHGQVVERLGRELRVKSMAGVGDSLADVLMGPLRQVAVMYLQGESAPTADAFSVQVPPPPALLMDPEVRRVMQEFQCTEAGARRMIAQRPPTG